MYDTSGLYVDTLQSIGGCDSIVTLDLTINESYDDVVDTLYRCVGSTYVEKLVDLKEKNFLQYIDYLKGVYLLQLDDSKIEQLFHQIN